MMMFKDKNSFAAVFCSIFSVCLAFIVSVLGGTVVNGIFCVAAVILMGWGQRTLGYQKSKEDNLGKLVGTDDLLPGRYLVGKDSYGRIVISKHKYATRCTEGAPGVRLFDHTTSSIPVQYLRDLPIGGSLLVEKASCGGWAVLVGMAA